MLMASSSSQEQQDTGRELVAFIVSRRIKVCFSCGVSLADDSDEHTDTLYAFSSFVVQEQDVKVHKSWSICHDLC